MLETAANSQRTRLFLSYGRRDASGLANRLRADLEKLGYEVWQDTHQIRAGQEWEHEIRDGLRSTQVVIALLSPHAVRCASDPNSSDCADSVCLDELTFARFAFPPTPIVPVMAIPCEPPFTVFRLDYIEMTKWTQSDDEYRRGFERLAQGIEASARGEALPFRRWYHRLPVFDFAAELNEKRQDFVGRQWLFDEIDAWRASSERERALLIVGDPGIGKSAFVAEMVHRNPGGQVIAYHICRADDPETLRPSNFIMSLAGMIAGRLPAFAELLESQRFQELFDPRTISSRPQHVFDQGLITGLHQLAAPDDGVRYLLIDALDEALTLGESEFDIVTLLSTRLQKLPGWLRVVATTRREPDVLNKLSSLRASAIDAHRQDNLDDIDDFIESRLRSPNLAERLAGSGVPISTVKDQLRQKGDGNFLYVSQALQDIEADIYAFNSLEALPRGLTQYYESWFRRKFPYPHKDYVNAGVVLEVMLTALEPLALDLLAAMAGVDAEYVLQATMSALVPIVANKNGTFSFYHKSVADWLAATSSPYRVSTVAGVRRILQYLDANLSLDPRDWNPYALRHALAHFSTSRFQHGAESISTSDPHVQHGYSMQWDKLNSRQQFHRMRTQLGIDRLFISNLRQESSELSMKLVRDLTAAGLRVWLDYSNLKAGEEWLTELERGIDTECDTVLVLAGDHYFSSEFTKRELTLACKQGKGIIVLAIDKLALAKWLRDGFNVIDFTEWRHCYERAFCDLLRNWLEVRHG